jgi:phosphatidylglycerol---prolipoprotein diacylglyceryl transferase
MFASPGSIAFQIGPLAVRWYGLLIAAGVMLGTTLAHREALRRGQDPDKLLNLIVVVVLSALLGARLYYVLFNWDYYGTQLPKVFAIWEGGLAIHGGLIAGALATLLYCRTVGLSVPMTMDIMAPGRPSAGGGTSSTRRPSGPPPTFRGACTSIRITGLRA